ncbi:MAG: FAD-dependent oxidoreductase [Alphaproteobacteria bacterium]|nr:FAD-dependent oxidoreductase [Alphaproteobacteria bacterium]
MRVHVVGAGLAGLSAAVELVERGVAVTVHEAAKQAGGRCRSFYDPRLDAVIDNGAHLILSGNDAVMDYVRLIGAEAELVPAPRATFPFCDVRGGGRWEIDLGVGTGVLALLPWLFDSVRRPPGLAPWRFVRDLLALRRGRGRTVSQCVDVSCAHHATFWEPLTLAVLNAHPHEASAQLLWAALAETVLRGGAFARPVLPRVSLDAALVSPAVERVRSAGGEVRFSRALKAIRHDNGRALALAFSDGDVALGEGDRVVLAVSPWAVERVLEGVAGPAGFRAILNAHFRLDPPLSGPVMTGLVGGAGQWLFVRGSVASVTVSAAEVWMNTDAETIAGALWADAATALGRDRGVPPRHRVIKERRATPEQVPCAQSRRPTPQTRHSNVFLAGDWTATGLPATIEGAIRSGRRAARCARMGE